MVRCVTPLLGVIVWVAVSPLDSVVFSDSVSDSPLELVIVVVVAGCPKSLDTLNVVVNVSLVKVVVLPVIEVLVREVI
jgi:hypothetical protein